jgi:hypothetical protein
VKKRLVIGIHDRKTREFQQLMRDNARRLKFADILLQRRFVVVLTA